MNNQEQENQINEKQSEDVDNRRRFIKGAGIAAPVVLTLSSGSVFGAQCLSQVMSGNISNAGTGSCALGRKPSEWKRAVIGNEITQLVRTSNVRTPTSGLSKVVDKQVTASYAGTTNGRVSIVIETFKTEQTYKWRGTSFNYGVLTTTKIVTNIRKIKDDGTIGAAVSTPITVINSNPSPITGTNPENLDLNGIVISGGTFARGTRWEYTGGVPLNFVFIANDLSVGNNASGLPDAVCSDFTGGTAFGTSTMRAILCADVDSDDSATVAALLNASYTPKINYVLTVDQVNELIAGTCPVPTGYTNAAAFFKSTW